MLIPVSDETGVFVGRGKLGDGATVAIMSVLISVSDETGVSLSEISDGLRVASETVEESLIFLAASTVKSGPITKEMIDIRLC